ncbi:MAG: sulfatase [Promethearchaeota archaeon]
MASEKPNILFILIDDMGWKDLGCYGSSFYETPNIDNLASHGMKFTDAYAACPVCSPTRASILTGKYPATLGVTQYIGGNGKGKLIGVPYIKQLPLEETTIAKKLRDEAGYLTASIGKWHLGKEPYYPQHHGFDVNIAGCDWGMPAGGFFSPYYMENLEDGPKGEFLTDRLTTEAINFIQKNGPEKPFFMYLSYYAVHIPIEAPEHLVWKYKEKAKRMGLDKEEEFSIGEHFPIHSKRKMHINRRLIQSNPRYAAMIERLDWNIGRILESLEELGILENTLIFFYSDNGGLSTAEGSPTTNKPLSEGKGWMYEGGTREPLIAVWKDKIAAGSECSIPVTSPDFFPTIMDITQTDFDVETVEGVSIKPLLLQEGEIEQNRPLFWHYPHYSNQGGTPGSSIRMGDYKLIHFYEGDKLELYNLKEDVEERNDVSTEYPDITKKLYDRLNTWRISIEAKIPEINSEYGKETIFSKIKAYLAKWSIEFWEYLMRHGKIKPMKLYAKKQLKKKRPLLHE